jgi:preprotein translocase subunit SecD
VLEVADPSKAEDIKTAVQKKVELGDTSTWSYSVFGNQLVWAITGSAPKISGRQCDYPGIKYHRQSYQCPGITEPTLQTHGAKVRIRYFLQMPGVQDPERVKNLLKGESRLELVHVVSPPVPAPSQTYATEAEAIIASSTVALPRIVACLKYVERWIQLSDCEDQSARKEQVGVVEAPAIIDGSELRNATRSRTSRWYAGLRD